MRGGHARVKGKEEHEREWEGNTGKENGEHGRERMGRKQQKENGKRSREDGKENVKRENGKRN